LKRLLSAWLALGWVAASAGAAEHKTSLRASAGVASPTGTFGDSFGSAPNFALAVGHDLGRYATVSLNLEYAGQFAVDEDAVRQRLDDDFGIALQQLGIKVNFDGGDTRFLTATVDLKGSVLGHDRSFSPYVIAGGGMTHRSTGDLDVTFTLLGLSESDTLDGTSESAACISFGAGFDLTIAERTGIFLEGRYHIAFTEDQSAKYTSVRFGFRVQL
jgi:hypothetical protein